MKAFTFISDIFNKYPFLIILNSVTLLIVSFVELAAVLSLAPLVDFYLYTDLKQASSITRHIVSYIEQIGLPVSLGSFIVLFLVFTFVAKGIYLSARYLILETKLTILRDLLLGTFEDFFNARWLFFAESKQGTLLNTFNRELTIVGDALGTMALFVANILQLIIYCFLPFMLSWKITSISLAAASLFAIPFFLLGKVSYKLGKLKTETANRMMQIIQENFGNVKVILGFGNAQNSLKNISNVFDEHRKATIKSQFIQLSIPQIYHPCGLIIVIIVLVIGKHYGLPMSDTAVLLYALFKIIPLVAGVVTQKNSMDNLFPSYEQLLVLKQKAIQMAQKPGKKKFKGFNREIILDNVLFAYPGNQYALIDVNLNIVKGKMIAIVGESGAGKSTLVDLLMGFIEPNAGQIIFDDVPLHEFDINSFRHRIGYVPQESFLFNMTIEDNLRWAKNDATKEEIEQACRLANASKFIEELPDGYDTITGDRGVRLSGGQIQRLALSRAILRKPEILLLDEATSSLDTHSERLIQKAIENIAGKSTIIVIAHRLSTIVNADYIYAFKKGRVVEEGTFAQLTEMGGYFNSMVESQKLNWEKKN